MDNAEVLIEEYKTLRKEIAATKIRRFKTIGYGIAIVPAASLLAQRYEMDILTLSLPVLVIVVAMLYLSENNAIMRCGQYIKENLEPRLKGLGWERWLEGKHSCKPRNAELHLTLSFYILFFVYYLLCSCMSCQFALSHYQIVISSVLIGAYTSLGIWFFIFLLSNIKTSTGGCVLITDTQPDD